ncbi:MAG: hypothetical protein HY782_27155 [Chloroflexi bacterium]|nr:hypothetical protein [Chloroflexota bacterium]
MAQLVRRLTDPDLAYMFKHTLAQESVYESMLKSRRGELHRAVAQAIENVRGGQLEQDAAMLAWHYERAGQDDKAFTYAALAGDVAARAYAHQEALMFYDRALALAERLKTPELNDRVRAINANRGRVFEVAGQHLAAIENYRQMIAFAQRMGDLAMEADGLSYLLTAQGILGQTQDTDRELNRALELARQSGDPALVGRALWNIGLSIRFTNPERAADYFRQTLEHARANHLRELAAYALTDLAVELQFTGEWREAHGHILQALEEFRALDNQPMIANALGMLAESYHGRGEADPARAAAEEGYQISQAIENPWGMGYNEWSLLALDLQLGDFDRVFGRAEHLLAVAGALNVSLFKGMTHLHLARAYGALNQIELAQAAVEQADKFLSVMNLPFWPVATAAIHAQVLLEENKLAQARALLEPFWHDETNRQASIMGLALAGAIIPELAFAEGRLDDGLEFCDWLIARLEQEEARGYACELYYFRGLIRDRLGDANRAEQDLHRAAAITERAQNDLLRWRVQAALAKLYAARGETDRAQAARQRAVEPVRTIAGRISNPTWRAGFLQRKDVAEVLKSEGDRIGSALS